VRTPPCYHVVLLDATPQGAANCEETIMTPTPGSPGRAVHPRRTRLVILATLLLAAFCSLPASRPVAAAPPDILLARYPVAPSVARPYCGRYKLQWASPAEPLRGATLVLVLNAQHRLQGVLAMMWRGVRGRRASQLADLADFHLGLTGQLVGAIQGRRSNAQLGVLILWRTTAGALIGQIILADARYATHWRRVSGAQAAPHATRPPVYTVSQIMRQSAHLARMLSGQLLLVRGVIWGCEAGMAGTGTRCLSLQPVLVDSQTGARMGVILEPPVRGAPIQHIRWGRLATYRARLVARSASGGYALALPDTDAALIDAQGHG
jgi:hypothetical protein